MTGTLKLSVELDARRKFATSGVAVRIGRLNEPSDVDVEGWTVLVPTSGPGLSVEVPPGTYILQAWLPSGQILRRSATVETNRVAPVEFLEKTRKTRDGGDRVARERLVDLHREFHPLEFQPAFSSGTDPFAGERAVDRIDFLRERASTRSWSQLRSAEEGTERLSEHFQPEQIEIELASHAETTTVSIRTNRLSDPNELTSSRHWVRVRDASGARIGALPMPWLSSGIGETRPQIEISYEHLQHRLEITVRDNALDLLLAYMKRGRLSAAEMSVESLSRDGTLLEAIRDKRGNPLAACAAAYVSLAKANKNQIDAWRSWAPNLMNWFPWMPDGAIVRACTLMDGPVTSRSKREILTSAKEAYRRGVPFFTVGILHLREMLSLFGSDDPEARDMLDAVRSISSRCDISEAFTTLRYPSH